jgi:hypothetical protein
MNREEFWNPFAERLANLHADEEHGLRHPDYVMDIATVRCPGTYLLWEQCGSRAFAIVHIG